MRVSEAELHAMLARGDARIADEAGQPVKHLHHPALRPPPLPDTGQAGLLHRLQALAEEHQWAGMHTYNPDGPDQGLHVTLVREGVLMAEIKGPHDKLTPSQQRWLAALRATGAVEVYVWATHDWPAIVERLTRRREP